MGSGKKINWNKKIFFTRKISVLKRDFSSGTGLFYSGTGLDVKDGFFIVERNSKFRTKLAKY